MASIIDQPQMRSSQRLLTVADLAALPDELPSGPVKYELDQGRLVTLMSPPGEMHGAHQATIVTLLKLLGERPGHGKALGEVAIILRRNPDRVYAPDAAFIARRSLPVRTSPQGYLATIPELVVEVRSKNDGVAAIRAKADLYVKAGVTLAWAIAPTRKTIRAYRTRQT